MSDLPKPPKEELVGPEFAATTIWQLIERTTAGHLHGVGNAVEANFVYRLGGKNYICHMHLCIRDASAESGDTPKPATTH